MKEILHSQKILLDMQQNLKYEKASVIQNCGFVAGIEFMISYSFHLYAHNYIFIMICTDQHMRKVLYYS